MGHVEINKFRWEDLEPIPEYCSLPDLRKELALELARQMSVPLRCFVWNETCPYHTYPYKKNLYNEIERLLYDGKAW